MSPSTPTLGLLIGSRVRDGDFVGIVVDVRCRRGPGLDRSRLFVDSVVVDRAHRGRMLGFDSHQQSGPALIRILVDRLHRNRREIPWRQLREESGGYVVVPR